MCFFFFKQKTAYEMRISDWSSDVCSSDLSGTANSYKMSNEMTDSTKERHRPDLPCNEIGVLPVEDEESLLQARDEAESRFLIIIDGEHVAALEIGRASCRGGV